MTAGVIGSVAYVADRRDDFIFPLAEIIGDIQGKGEISPDVGTGLSPVYVDGRELVNRPEMQENPAAGGSTGSVVNRITADPEISAVPQHLIRLQLPADAGEHTFG